MKPLNVVTVDPSPLKLLRGLAIGGLLITGGVAGMVLSLSIAYFGMNWLMSSGWVIVAVTAALVVGCGGALFLAATYWTHAARRDWARRICRPHRLREPVAPLE